MIFRIYFIEMFEIDVYTERFVFLGIMTVLASYSELCISRMKLVVKSLVIFFLIVFFCVWRTDAGVFGRVEQQDLFAVSVQLIF